MTTIIEQQLITPTNTRFIPRTIMRTTSAALLALVLGFHPLTASAAVLGAACSPNGTATAIGGGNWYICQTGVWTVGVVINYPLNNVAIGTQSKYTSSGNTSIGSAALMNSTGPYNVAIGGGALSSNGSGTNNTGLGASAGSANVTGINNTFIGAYANANGGAYTNVTALGANATVTASNMVRIGNTAVTVIRGHVPFTSDSDRRLKKDIEDSDLGLAFIQKLRPVSYRMKEGNDRLDYGFIGQEVEGSLDGRVTNMVAQENDEMKTYEMRGNDLIAPLVKGMQQQQEIIENLQKEIDALKKSK